MTEKKKFERTVADQMEMKGTDESIRERTFFIFRTTDENVTYQQFYQRSSTYAHFFQRMHGQAAIGDDKVRTAVFMNNHPAFFYSYGGCALTGGTLFGINTGMRGQVLADLINQSQCQCLIADDRHIDRIVDVLDKLEHLAPERIFVQKTDVDNPPMPKGARDLEEVLAELGKEMGDAALVRPAAEVSLDDTLMIIYTSGTTGLPKGIKNSQGKLMNLGMVTGMALGIKPDDRGYICMPLFHSNAMFLGTMSAFNYNASVVLRDKFSARGLAKDVLKYGVTYWNYVGQPVHYVILALEAEFEIPDEVVKNVAEHPDNKLRVAYGNGASQTDQDRFINYFGLDDMMEGYGTTEMAIATLRHIGDPKGSVGFIMDNKVKIFNDHGQECPAAEYDDDEKFLNYQEAVGEIVREGGALPAFEGYHDNPDATSSKIKDGVYHSGDLGHIRVVKNRRFLYFDGRTDDWIRKDGENFSAQTVGALITEHPAIEFAVAYGVPCPVSDEWVMVSLKLYEGAQFDPMDFFEFMKFSTEYGNMDKKWTPEFVRIVDDFEYTRTQKILVRPLKHEYYNLEVVPKARIYFLRRDFNTYRDFNKADLQDLKDEFKKNGREQLLETWR